eukprot:25135_1
MTTLINEQKRKNIKEKHLLIIIDRQVSDTNDTLFITQYNENKILLNELEENTYFIGMTFDISPNVNKAYLTYGNQQKWRFYPEQLTRIVTRLFKQAENKVEYLNKLYSSSYKQ